MPRFFLSFAQGFASRTVAERRAQNERLFVMRFAREGQVERAGGEASAGAGAPPARTLSSKLGLCSRSAYVLRLA